MTDDTLTSALPTDVVRLGLAAALEVEAKQIEGTALGSPERRQLQTRWLSSRPNDNDHVGSARRVAQLLRAGQPVVQLVHGSRYYRRAFMDLLPAEEPRVPVEQPRSEPLRVTVEPSLTPPSDASNTDEQRAARCRSDWRAGRAARRTPAPWLKRSRPRSQPPGAN